MGSYSTEDRGYEERIPQRLKPGIAGTFMSELKLRPPKSW
jgi:hypothetical protein